jgi:hypothetical protein
MLFQTHDSPEYSRYFNQERFHSTPLRLESRTFTTLVRKRDSPPPSGLPLPIVVFEERRPNTLIWNLIIGSFQSNNKVFHLSSSMEGEKLFRLRFSMFPLDPEFFVHDSERMPFDCFHPHDPGPYNPARFTALSTERRWNGDLPPARR